MPRTRSSRSPQGRGDPTRGHFGDGLDAFWRDVLAPRVARMVALDAETARYLRQRYRRLCRRAGFELLKRAHPRDAVQWYLDSVPGLTWRWQ
jgi:hypothetical protein